jgi:DNA polymerase III subunit delta
MRLSSENLAQHLKQKLSRLYTIHGPETLLALEAADAIRGAARAAGHTERETYTMETGFDSSTLLNGSRNQSLFAERKIVELRIPTGKPGVDGAKTIERYCASLGDDVLTLVTLPKLDRTTLTSAWFTTLENAGVVVSADEVSRGQLPSWLQGRLAQQNQTADRDALQFLVDRVEGNLVAAQQEIRKLALLFPAGTLSFDMVKDAVLDVARYDIFGLSEAMLSGNAARFVRTLEGLRDEGEAPPLMLWSLTEEIRALLKVKIGQSQGKPMAQLLRDARVWGPRQGLIERGVKRLTQSSLEAALSHAAECDRIIKGVRRGDLWDEMLALGMRVAAPNS